MQHRNRWLVAGLLLAAMPTMGCGKSSEFDAEPAADTGAAKVVEVKGVERVVLTALAAKRLGIETARVTHGSGGQLVIPYSAVLYDASGKAFAFTSPAPLAYEQSAIKVAYVKGKSAVLRSGPPAGTSVVTVGSAELLGTAHGVEEE